MPLSLISVNNLKLKHLFNMEVNIQPRLRFSEFKESWNKTFLNDIATFSKGKNISKSDIAEDGSI